MEYKIFPNSSKAIASFIFVMLISAISSSGMFVLKSNSICHREHSIDSLTDGSTYFGIKSNRNFG